jgi:hypothetical protein
MLCLSVMTHDTGVCRGCTALFVSLTVSRFSSGVSLCLIRFSCNYICEGKMPVQAQPCPEYCPGLRLNWYTERTMLLLG